MASGADTNVYILDADDGRVKQTLVGWGNVRNGYLAIAWNNRLWNVYILDVIEGGGAVKQTLSGHNGTVNALAVLQNGYLASASSDSTVRVWNMNDGSLVTTLVGHTASVNALAVLSDGNLASGANDFTIKIWSTNPSFIYKRVQI